MGDWGGAPGRQHLLLAEILGLAMARRAADILDRHRAALMGAPADVADASLADARPVDAGRYDAGRYDAGPAHAGRYDANSAAAPAEADDAQFALDNAIFTAVLDAANECLGLFDARPSDERWCDALLQLIQLAQVARDPAQLDQAG
jgi:hypothetical protein